MSEGLADIVAEVLGDAPSPEAETPPTEAPETPEPQESDNPAEGEPEPEEPEEEPAPDKEEWTPERIAEERTALQAEKDRLQKFHAQEKKRWAKANRKREEYLTERKTFESQREAFLEDVKVVRTGSGAQVLDALQRLTGRNARETYEEMSLALIGKPKEEPKEDPHTAELRKKLEDLEKAQAQREQHAAIEAEVSRLKGIVTEGAKDWPLIAHELESDPQGTINDLATLRMRWHEQHGEWVDWSVILTNTEPQLRAHFEAKAAKLGLKPSQGGPAGPDTSAAPTAKTGGRETPTKHGTTVRQRATQSSASRREMTEAERLAYAAEAIPDGFFG